MVDEKIKRGLLTFPYELIVVGILYAWIRVDPVHFWPEGLIMVLVLLGILGLLVIFDWKPSLTSIEEAEERPRNKAENKKRSGYKSPTNLRDPMFEFMGKKEGEKDGIE